MWGKQHGPALVQSDPRRTPTYVGKTGLATSKSSPSGTDPHVRKEDASTARNPGSVGRETPTRVGKTLVHLRFRRQVGRLLLTLHELAVLIRAAVGERCRRRSTCTSRLIGRVGIVGSAPAGYACGVSSVGRGVCGDCSRLQRLNGRCRLEAGGYESCGHGQGVCCGDGSGSEGDPSKEGPGGA